MAHVTWACVTSLPMTSSQLKNIRSKSQPLYLFIFCLYVAIVALRSSDRNNTAKENIIFTLIKKARWLLLCQG